MQYIRLADPFWGNGAMRLPEPEGIAATWFFIKAQCGNTLPGAFSPFSIVSACAYSGGYPTGYGMHHFNYHSEPPRIFNEYRASAFSHFHHSGTGAIGSYYNYIRVTPFCGTVPAQGTSWPLRDETANPGYYAATLDGAGIRAELTAGDMTALHRYHFPDDAHPGILVDLSRGGLLPEKAVLTPSEHDCRVSGTHADLYVRFEGIPIYVHLTAEDAKVTPYEDSEGRYGLLIRPLRNTVLLRLDFSFQSAEKACKRSGPASITTFDGMRSRTEDAFSTLLSRVEIQGGDPARRRIFYSALYHSLLKPAVCGGESPYWTDGPECCSEFSTMWDLYKTQLPLILTLYPEYGGRMVNSLLRLRDFCGFFPNMAFLNARIEQVRDSNQARCLAHYTIADAFFRGIGGIDYAGAVQAMRDELLGEANSDYRLDGRTSPFVTQTLDLSGACVCTAELAGALGRGDIEREMDALSRNWRNIYDAETGLLCDATYYEGGRRNYSFRLLPDMASRIALHRSPEDFVRVLDDFFGYGKPPVRQSADPRDPEPMKRGSALETFEGFNNEPDMETPYAYLYAGRHDRTAEVNRAGLRFMFTEGRGGLPGNNDSGGLSSLYVWNSIGLFPVAGQPVMLIGSPVFDRTVLHLPGGDFTVEAEGASEQNIYIRRAYLNGREIKRAYLTVGELMSGGTLRLLMDGRPSDFGTRELPPSRRAGGAE